MEKQGDIAYIRGSPTGSLTGKGILIRFQPLILNPEPFSEAAKVCSFESLLEHTKWQNKNDFSYWMPMP
jgi:hypothetical protein